MTLQQWLDSVEPQTLQYAAEYMQLTQQEGFAWGVIRTAYACVSQLCIIQLQDCLELGGEARMNFPGTTGNNWVWRTLPGSFDSALAAKLSRLAVLYDRTN
jgi:4-alpha-glucanotransferase